VVVMLVRWFQTLNIVTQSGRSQNALIISGKVYLKEREGMLIINRLKYAYYLPKHTLHIFIKTKTKQLSQLCQYQRIEGNFSAQAF
jgi:hypothetical protein